MRYRVWRSLDRPSSFFGIRGKFAYVFLAITGAGAAVSFIAGKFTGGFTGMLLFAASAVGSYLTVMSLQGKMTDRGLSRRTASRRIPKRARVLPRSVVSQLKGQMPWK